MRKMLRVLAVTGAVALITGSLLLVPTDARGPSAPQAPASGAGGGSAAPQQQPASPPSQPAQAQSPSGDQQPVFRAGINFVRVDVIVTDRNGNAVQDLKPGDFEIIEQKIPQKIETFKLISLDGGLMATGGDAPRTIRTDLDEETEAARDDVRLFAIFLDDYHVRRETSMSARSQVARFVETQLGPSDMVGLMYPLQPMASVRMTRDHDAVSRGIQQFLGRKYDYTPRNEMEERYANYPTEVVEKVRNQVSMTALKSLIVHMGGLKEGRKALILVSEGYNAMLPPQMRDQMATMPGMGNSSRDNPDAGIGNPMEDRAAFSANMDLDSEMRDLTDLANKNNTAIYTVDPRGLATTEFGPAEQNISIRTDSTYLNASIDTLRTLAQQTDGRAIINRNDLTLGMKQIVRDSSVYYLLGYSSTFTATDGKFHEIKVNVKRPGVQVRARRGYWAFTPEDAARALAPPKPEPPAAYTTALASIIQPSRFRIIRTWIGTERGSDGKTKVTFVWEPVPKAFGDASRATETPARVALTALAADGAPYFRGPVPGPAAGGQSGARVTFDVPPGTIQLRVAVENASADVLDSEVREVSIPDLAAPETSVGTPTVFRARTVREYQQIKADAQATPTASREFSRTERVLIRVPAYGRGGTPPGVTAKLLNRGGQPIGDLPVAAASWGGDVKEIELALASMPAGEYLVEIVVSGAGAPLKEVIGFRITS